MAESPAGDSPFNTIENVRLTDSAGQLLGTCPSPAWYSAELEQPYMPIMHGWPEFRLRLTFGQVPDEC